MHHITYASYNLIMLCLLQLDSALCIPQSCHLALVQFDWNGTMTGLEQQAVVLVMVGDYAKNAMNEEVAIVSVDTGDVVDVGTARKWVDNEPQHRQPDSLGKQQHGEANGVQPLAQFGNHDTKKRLEEDHNPLWFDLCIDLIVILKLNKTKIILLYLTYYNSFKYQYRN